MVGKAAHGGGGTIHGVLYQLLWSLLKVASLQILNSDYEAKAKTLSSATVLLEPASGGDIQFDEDVQVVVQLKSRSNGAAWSLQDVIKKVLPDLFIAVDDSPESRQEFRFVTEAKMGRWERVYEGFFRDLVNREPFTLDDSTLLETGGQRGENTSSFYPEPCTEKALFSTICDVINTKPSIKKLKLDSETIQKRVWKLLSGFVFCDPINVEEVEAKVDTLLLSVIDNADQIADKRRSMAFSLGQLSVSGDVTVKALEFLDQHGLSATSLSKWNELLDSAKGVLQRSLTRRQYNSAIDLRRATLPRQTKRVLVINGDSGCGKSWLLNALANDAVDRSLIPLLIESKGNADADLKQLADIFWVDVRGGETSLALMSVGKRLDKVVGKGRAGLLALVDGVSSFDEAKALVDFDWESIQSHLVISCSKEVAASLAQICASDRLQVEFVGDFHWADLHEYLRLRIGETWATIPSDIRSTLLTPLLAAMYCDQFGSDGFQPTNEYQLFDQVYEKKTSGFTTATPLDQARVENLARDFRDGGSYPWTPQQLTEADIDDQCVGRLTRSGWLARSDDGMYRVFHDRLLRWAVASVTLHDLIGGKCSPSEITNLYETRIGLDNRSSSFLGYVAMDFLWLLCTRRPKHTALAVNLLKVMEEQSRSHYGDVYEVVETVGECAADAVFTRYCEFKTTGYPAHSLADCLRVIAGDRLEGYVKKLLQSDDKMDDRRAVNLVSDISMPVFAPDFWRVHKAGIASPEAFGQEEERAVFLYNETVKPLKKAAIGNHAWLDRAIRDADHKADPIKELAWLVANLDDDGVLWRKHKGYLIDQLENLDSRPLISCIGRHSDEDEVERLKVWVAKRDDFVHCEALRAMSRIDIDQAVGLLSKTDPGYMRMCKHWCFYELFERDPSGVSEEVTKWMQDAEYAWDVGLLFAERVNDISSQQLDLLLDALVVKLAEREPNDKKYDFWSEFHFLGRLAAVDLIAVLQKRNDSDLDEAIASLLLEYGTRDSIWGGLSPVNGALMTLNLMGSKKFTVVINNFLQDSNAFGLSDTIPWAVKCPDKRTFSLLEEIVRSDESWPGNGTASSKSFVAINQNAALRCIASHHLWEEVVKGVKLLGPHLYDGLELPKKPISGDWVDALKAESTSMPNIGNINALAVAGGEESGEIILKTLQQCGQDSDLAVHCIVSLKQCKYFSDVAVAEVASFLSMNKYRYAANQFLTYAGTDAAWDVIASDLEENFDYINALNLINLSKHAERAIEIVIENMPNGAYRGAEHQSREILFNRIQNPEYRSRIAETSTIQTMLHQAVAGTEGGIWFTGSKAYMIKCISYLDPGIAVDACLGCIRDRKAKDRERYPSLLLEIQPVAAVDLLVDELRSLESHQMRKAIARALTGTNVEQQIEQLHVSGDHRDRRAACELAGISHTERSKQILTRLLQDDDEEVIRASIAGLQTQRDFHEASKLIIRIDEESDRRMKTALIDCYVNTCQSGDPHRALTEETLGVLQNLSDYEWKLSRDRLKKRIEKREKALARKDK